MQTFAYVHQIGRTLILGTMVTNKNGFLKRIVAEWGCDSPRSPDTPHKKKTLGAKQEWIGPDGASTYTAVTGGKKKEYRKVEDKLQSASIIKEDEEIVGIVEEVFYGSMLQQLEELVEDTSQGDRVILVESVEMYEIIAEMGPDALRKEEAMIGTTYKIVEKKV